MNPSWAQLTSAGLSQHDTTYSNYNTEESTMIPPPPQTEQTADTDNMENSETSSFQMETTIIKNLESQTNTTSGDQGNSKEAPFHWTEDTTGGNTTEYTMETS
jgi:hypothetical protein